MSVSYRIEVVEGPRRGDSFPLKKRNGLTFGRGKGTVDMLDPQVSTRQCSVEWSEGQFVVRDLNSAGGTRVEGVDVGEEPVALLPNGSISIGESVLRLREQRALLPQWVYWVALVVLLISVPGFLRTLVDISLWDKMVPLIDAPNPVMGHGGKPVNPAGDPRKVPLDRCFMREVGSAGDGFRIRRVTDWDGDGVGEIWVEGDTWERVYTFDTRGNWVLLGEIPSGCQNSEGSGFRDLHCGNRLYRFRPGLPFQPGQDRCAVGSNKGRYELSRMSGAVVWLPSQGQTLAHPQPYQFGIRSRQDLAAWLGERNIDGQVHFIVCEDMFPGLGAQVLTSDGRIERLQPGCTNTLHVGGGRSRDYEGRPYAVAFTETGHRLLAEQMGVFLGGSEMGHFQNREQRAWWTSLSSLPSWHGASFIVFTPAPTASTRFFNPIPPEDPRLQVRPFHRLGGLSVPGRLRASVWRWTESGTVLQTACGQYVKIDPMDWRCGPPCVRGRTPFLKISQVNGPNWEVPYQQARGLRLRGAGIELEVDVQTAPSGYVTQAVAASVAVRDNDVCAGSPIFQGPEVKPLQ
ncbi:MAG: FHA domain-containing protein [Deltaproteobacteria bacterium]|nr:MAG: FHA domain-containing protein [Deltaproteobacteria bacterium]